MSSNLVYNEGELVSPYFQRESLTLVYEKFQQSDENSSNQMQNQHYKYNLQLYFQIHCKCVLL